VPQLRPAPRLSRTPGELRPTYAFPGCDTEAVLGEFGLSNEEIDRLAANNVITW